MIQVEEDGVTEESGEFNPSAAESHPIGTESESHSCGSNEYKSDEEEIATENNGREKAQDNSQNGTTVQVMDPPLLPLASVVEVIEPVPSVSLRVHLSALDIRAQNLRLLLHVNFGKLMFYI